MSELWQQLVANALLGVEPRPFVPPPDAGALSDIIGQLDAADPEGALRAAAAIVALFQRNGQLPPREDAPLPAPCEDDALPACSPRAARHLATMLGGTHRALLPEWLAALADAGRRAPAALLPELLELGRAHADMRQAILPALDRRGRWLAAHNPEWSYASSEFRVQSSKLDDGAGSEQSQLLTLNSQLIGRPDLARLGSRCWSSCADHRRRWRAS
jgi:hypothetical protein